MKEICFKIVDIKNHVQLEVCCNPTLHYGDIKQEGLKHGVKTNCLLENMSIISIHYHHHGQYMIQIMTTKLDWMLTVSMSTSISSIHHRESSYIGSCPLNWTIRWQCPCPCPSSPSITIIVGHDSILATKLDYMLTVNNLQQYRCIMKIFIFRFICTCIMIYQAWVLSVIPRPRSDWQIKAEHICTYSSEP